MAQMKRMVGKSKKSTGIQATKKQVERIRTVANLVAPFAPAKKAVERTVGKSKTTTKAPAKKLVGPAAVAELKKQVSKAGVKKSEMKQKEAIDKKYPGLYKKSK